MSNAPLQDSEEVPQPPEPMLNSKQDPTTPTTDKLGRTIIIKDVAFNTYVIALWAICMLFSVVNKMAGYDILRPHWQYTFRAIEIPGHSRRYPNPDSMV